MSNKGIFEGLVYDQDRFQLFPRCYGKFIGTDPQTKKATGCTLSAFWVGLGFEPNTDTNDWKHPLTGDRYTHNGLTQQTDKLALAYGVVPEDQRAFTSAIMSAHDASNDNNRSHEYKAMQLIYKLVDKAGLIEKVAVPEAISMSALKAMIK